MPRRKTKLSPTAVILLMFFVVIMRGLMLLPSNDDVVLSSHLIQQMDQRHPSPLERGTERNQTILFVHVGKTGGETIQWRLRLSCKLRRSKLMKEECFKLFTGEESSLSRATIGHLHCDKLRPRESLIDSSIFMFSLRNPVDRISSWFQYMHPDNCVPNIPSGACNLKKENHPWGRNFYQTCFPDVNDFVRSLREPMIRGSINCSALALETVHGSGPEGPSNHMHYNYFYYANRTIHRYPTRQVLVVRQEMLWDDLRTVERYLGGDQHRPFERQGPTITHGSEKFAYRASLDPDLVPHLCCAIPKEIKTYKYLLQRAENLDSQQKLKSFQELSRKCQSPSFEDLVRKCSWSE